MRRFKVISIIIIISIPLFLFGGCNSISNVAAQVKGGFSEDDIAGGWQSSNNGPIAFNQGVFYFSPNEKAGGQSVKLLFLKLSNENDTEDYAYTISRVSDKSFAIKYYSYNILQDKLVYTSDATDLSVSMVDKKTLQICGNMTGGKILTLSKVDGGMAKQIVGLQ